MGNEITGLFGFLREYDTSLLIALLEHLQLVGTSVLIALVIGLPLGALAWRSKRIAAPVFLVANLIQTIPSIALFGLMIPVLALINSGIGVVPATIALVLYAQLPIIRNTYTALGTVPESAIDAARGAGMTELQILTSVALPIAAPGIIAGLRLATTLCIGVAAIATYIGAGGLGFFIARGLSSSWDTMILAGGAGIALLTIVIELLLRLVERRIEPRGMRERDRQPAALERNVVEGRR